MAKPSHLLRAASFFRFSSWHRPQAIALGAFLATVTASGALRAAPVWTGDFETNDLSQWSNALNGTHISVVSSPVNQGMYAGQIQLTNDATWPNGLKRVELHHSPAQGRTDSGKETYFAWSFYLPVLLPVDPSQQIGYWETDSSYQQLMAFNVAGDHMQFITQKPQYQVQWEADGMATAGTWHRIAIHIGFNQDPAQGFVDVWFDGTQVVNHIHAATLADQNSAFTQVGLLRGAIEFQDSPIIVLDDAVEGDSLADVHPELPTSGQGGAGGGATVSSTAASVTSAASTSAVGGNQSSGATSGGGGAGGAASSGDGSSGCGCALAPSPREDGAIGFLALAGLAISRRRRG